MQTRLEANKKIKTQKILDPNGKQLGYKSIIVYFRYHE
jgi:hypothetical protein